MRASSKQVVRAIGVSCLLGLWVACSLNPQTVDPASGSFHNPEATSGDGAAGTRNQVGDPDTSDDSVGGARDAGAAGAGHGALRDAGAGDVDTGLGALEDAGADAGLGDAGADDLVGETDAGER